MMQETELTGIVIDDDVDIVETISMYLELKEIKIKGKGYNGCDAAKLYEKTKPDFVLLDMKMPKYDGAYAIKKIKEMDPAAKIFVLTGYSDYDFSPGEVKKVFSKPYDIKRLVMEIRQAC